MVRAIECQNFIQTPCSKVMPFDGHLQNTLLVCTALTHSLTHSHTHTHTHTLKQPTTVLGLTSNKHCNPCRQFAIHLFLPHHPLLHKQDKHLRNFLLCLYFIIIFIKYFKFVDCNNILPFAKILLPVPVAAWSKASVCGLSPAEIMGSNPTGGMDICLL